jgi:hypothetical protein
MRRHLALVTTIILGSVLVTHVWAQPPWAQASGKNAGFQGYWMGVDPVDGGDARRSIIRLDNGNFALAARDTVFTLCDGTDRALGSFDDGVVDGKNVMRSDALTIQCFNVDASVVLRVRYELISPGLMNEFATLQDGAPVSTIVLHKVSAN